MNRGGATKWVLMESRGHLALPGIKRYPRLWGVANSDPQSSSPSVANLGCPIAVHLQPSTVLINVAVRLGALWGVYGRESLIVVSVSTMLGLSNAT